MGCQKGLGATWSTPRSKELSPPPCAVTVPSSPPGQPLPPLDPWSPRSARFISPCTAWFWRRHLGDMTALPQSCLPPLPTHHRSAGSAGSPPLVGRQAPSACRRGESGSHLPRPSDLGLFRTQLLARSVPPPPLRAAPQ